MVKLTETDKAYIKLASKSIRFPIDIKEGVFLVPEIYLEEAQESLDVRHIMRLFDFKIQTVIPGSVKLNEDIYDPVIRLAGHRPKYDPVEGLKTGDQFKIVSTETLIEVLEATKKTVKLKYVDSLKSDIVTNQEQVSKSLALGIWVKI